MSDIDTCIKFSDICRDCVYAYRYKSSSNINNCIINGIDIYLDSQSLIKCINILNRHYLKYKSDKRRFEIYNYYSFKSGYKFDNILDRYRIILREYMRFDEDLYPMLVEYLTNYIERDKTYDSEADTDIEADIEADRDIETDTDIEDD
jgi:hypothetical protein